MRTSAGLLAVLLAGEALLWAGLEGPASPLGPLAALALLLGPGLAAGLGRREVSAEGWVVLLAASFGLTALLLALTIPWLGFSAARLVPLTLGASALGWLWGRACRVEPPTEPAPDRTLWPLALLPALGAAAVLPAFLRIGRLTPQGFAFRTFFDHDFLVHLSVIGELGHGLFPPQNPYYGGATLRYYWLYFLFPALARKLGGEACSGPNTLVLCNYATVVLFCAALAAFLKRHAGRPARAFLIGALVILCGSFEGLLVLVRVRSGMLPAHLGEYNVDAVTRWYIAPPEIDALLRGLIYTHQHLAALGTLLALGLVLSRRDRHDVGWAAFVLLLPLPGLSAFVGGIAWLWVLGAAALDATGDPDRRWRGLLLGALAGVGCGYVACRHLDMFGPTPGFVQILPRPRTWQHLLTLLLLNFGAPGLLGLLAAGVGFWRRTRLSNTLLGLSALVLVLTWHGAQTGLFLEEGRWGTALYAAAVGASLAGLLVALRERHPGGRDALALCLIGLGAIVSGYIPNYVNEFGLRGGFVVAIGLGALIAGLWVQVERWPRWSRAVLGAVAALLAASALPTSLIDLRNVVNLQDARFITYVSPREAEALDWIRRNTPSEAVVQDLPNHLQAGRYPIGNLVNALGERRMAVGKNYYAGQFEVGKEPADERARAVTRIFRAGEASRRLRPIAELRIDFLVVGHEERTGRRTDPELFASRPDLFESVFDNGEVRVYRVDHEALAKALSLLPAQPLAEEPGEEPESEP
jgi:hypothetical protein